MTDHRHIYRVECGACGLRRVWRTGRAYAHDGRESGSVIPNGPGGPLDAPCPTCGTTDRTHVRRCWVPAAGLAAGWRYVGMAQPDRGYRVDLPDGDWPEPVQLADVTWPDPMVGPDPHAGALPPVGGQLTIQVAA